MEAKKENLPMRALYLLEIIFVVDGHIPLPDLFDMGGLMGYYSFHLMLFAFASGYFFRLYGNPGQDLLHRAKRLLAPLYLWNLVYGALAFLLRRFGGFTLGEPLSLYTLLLAPVTDGEHFVWNLGAWYLFPLFAVQVCYAALRRVSRCWKDEEGLTFLLCLLPGIAAVLRLQASQNEPLWLLRTLVLLPGYAAGVLYRRRLEEKDTLPALPLMAGILLARGILLLRFGNLSYLLSSGTYFLCGPAGVYLGGGLAIWFWVRVSRLLGEQMERSRLALYASRHTLSIMLHHYMGFFAMNAVFLLLNWKGLGAADFSVRSFRTQTGYVYAPGGGPGWTALYLAAGLLLPLALARIGERIRTCAGNKIKRINKTEP